jgi:CzcA family heavy metal efflux pump
VRGLIALSIQHRVVVALLAAVFLAYSAVSLRSAPLDVFPEFVEPQVTVQTEAPGFSPEQVEQLVTRPVEAAINGSSGLKGLRSESIAGLSVVSITFREGIDLTAARQGISESLAELGGRLPAGVVAPKMSPLTSSTMDLIKIGLVSDALDAFTLRDIADWTLKPRLLAVPGVARVTVFGGDVRQVHIEIDPARLSDVGLGINDVLTAARAATGLRGGGFVDLKSQRVLLNVSAASSTPAQIADAVVSVANGTPVRIRDVATVRTAAAIKSGDALIQGRPGILLAVSGQYGANTLEATRAAESALAELAPQLARLNVSIVSPLHRPANFIELALRDLTRSLAIGSVLIFVLLIVFLRDWRSALISFITIPLALGVAILVLTSRGETLNTLTLGGFAVALGVLIDDAIIDIENVMRRLAQNARLDRPRPAFDVILEASYEIRASIFYATVVVLLVFVPVFAMGGVQGRLLKPLAASFVLSVAASLAIALTVTPALCALFLKGAAHGRTGGGYWTGLQHRVMTAVDRRLAVVLSILLVVMLGCALLAGRLGGEFFPMFREGHFVLQVSSRSPGTNFSEMLDVGRSVTRELLALPYVATVEQQVGRAEQGEDTWGPHRSEFHVELKSNARIDQRVAQDEIRRILDRYPGVNAEVLTFLGDRISETLTGTTAQVVVNVVGSDLDALDRAARAIAGKAATIDGVVDLTANIQSGSPQIDIALDPAALSLYGVRPIDALEAVSAGYAGQTVGQLYDQDRVVDVVALLAEGVRGNPASIAELPVIAVDGTRLTLGALARVVPSTGRASIDHEAGRRRVSVGFNVAGGSAQTVVGELRDALKSVPLPAGTFVEISGIAQAQADAHRELLLFSAIAFLAITMVLGMAFRRRIHALLVLLNLPFALVGAIAAIALTGVGLSLGALIGLVTVFGVSARNAILLFSHYEHLVYVENESWSAELAWRGAQERLRPVLMTALATGLGLLPIAVALGSPGHEIEGPMAIAAIGGLVTSTLLTLLVLPAVAARIWRRQEPTEELLPRPAAGP